MSTREEKEARLEAMKVIIRQGNARAKHLRWGRYLQVMFTMDMLFVGMLFYALSVRFVMLLGFEDLENAAYTLQRWLDRYEDYMYEVRDIFDEADRKAGNPPIDWDKDSDE